MQKKFNWASKARKAKPLISIILFLAFFAPLQENTTKGDQIGIQGERVAGKTCRLESDIHV